MTDPNNPTPPPSPAAMDPAQAAVDEPLVRRTAALARLALDEDEVHGLARDFGRILAAFESLGDGDEDLAETRPGGVPLRADEPAACDDARRLLEAAPAREGDFFGVPKTLGGPE